MPTLFFWFLVLPTIVMTALWRNKPMERTPVRRYNFSLNMGMKRVASGSLKSVLMPQEIAKYNTIPISPKLHKEPIALIFLNLVGFTNVKRSRKMRAFIR